MKNKNESIVLYVARLALTLLIITGVVAAALAGVNSVTAPVIAQLNEQKTQQAIELVLPGGGEEIAAPAVSAAAPIGTVYRGENGYAVEVLPSGFDNTITMMVGIDNEGNVLGISVVKHTETAGLGAVAAATTSAGEAFRAQFVGQSGSVSVSKDGGQIDAITGATITSRAVCNGATAAQNAVKTVG